MKKIAIITLFGCFNYGNRLQNYAVQTLFEKRGYEVETLVCEKMTPRLIAGRIYRSLLRKVLAVDGETKQYNELNAFNKDKMKIRKIYSKNGLISDKYAKQYDFFVVGSDQVWNPQIRKDERDNFFLKFASRKQRICLSPSIAVNRIADNDMYIYKEGLEGFPFLSCRELDGAEEISRISDRNCEQIIDPTLVITCEEWKSFSKKSGIKKSYVLVFFLGIISEGTYSQIQQYADVNNCIIINLGNTKDMYYSVRPEIFVNLIDEAKMVFTDSFHVTAFSINMNTPFYVFDRRDANGNAVSSNMFSRIQSLVLLMGLEDRCAENSQINWNAEFNTTRCNEALQKLREKANLYIDKCLEQSEIPPVNLPENECTGCATCVASCPTHCIEMRENATGFLTPIITNHQECIRCEKCIKVCPLNRESNDSKQIVNSYAAWSLDKEKLEQSSSGAIFPLLAEYVIQNNGVVYAASFDEEFNVQHIRVDQKDGLKSLYRAKYVQSVTGDCFSNVKNDLMNNRFVLFCGTPCQIAGLRSYIDSDNSNLILVDFICHGVPSPLVWRKYLLHLKKTKLNGEIIKNVNFRKKEIDWQYYSFEVSSENKVFCEDRRNNIYMNAFLRNLTIRESCANCKFKGVNREADFTIADFWGIELIDLKKRNARGTSLVLIYTNKAKDIWNNIREKVFCEQVPTEAFWGKYNTALINSARLHENRKKFFSRVVAHDDVDVLLKKYATEKKRTLITRILGRIKNR